jgi:hypothetical protein
LPAVTRGLAQQDAVPLPALNPAHVRQVNLGFERQLFLSQALLLTQPPDVSPQEFCANPALQDGALSGI